MENSNSIVLELIPMGRENAIKRRELAELASLTDRQMRRAIQQLRAEGAPILNDMDGRGYYVSYEKREMQRQIKQIKSRISELAKQQAYLERYIRLEATDEDEGLY